MAALSALDVSPGELAPAFDPETTSYVVDLPLGAESVTITAEAASGSTIELDGEIIASRAPTAVPLGLGDNPIEAIVRAGSSERTYTVVVRRGPGVLERGYIKASNTGAIDNFGRVAIDGDTLVVGAPFEASSATGIDGDQENDDANESGAVYVFVRSGETWTQQAYIKASNTDADDLFGADLAIDGDTLVVSAIDEASAATGIDGDQTDNSLVGAGAVYVFVRTGTSWSQQAYIKRSIAAIDQFGLRVAIDGDTLVVGARGEDSSAVGVDGDQTNNDAGNAGAAYVFRRSGTSWAQEAYLKASNTDPDDSFGTCVLVRGDTIIIGAPGEASKVVGDQTDNSAPAAGAVYLFARENGVWSQTDYLKASNANADDNFGVELALSGNTLAVGAVGEASVDPDNPDNNNGSFAGAVYVFESTGGAWSQQAYIKASNPGRNDRFGGEIALDGDVLGVSTMFEDGSGRGINPEPDEEAPGSGAAYLYVRRQGQWTHQAYIKASNTDRGDLFGSSLDIEGDMLVIGAQHEDSAARGVGGDTSDNSAPSSGAVYIVQ